MTSAFQVATEIRTALRNQSHKTNEEFAELAAAYADECARANERLSRCVFFLHRGFRSEAIRQAELDPKLLEVVASLDFPEREQWVEASGRFQVVPPDLMTEAAIELNEAYELEHRLQPLVRMYRRLNLSRAPIGERCDVLRQIIRYDPHTAAWQENLRALE